MGGGGSQKIEPTEEEIALAEITAKQWEQYKEYGVPLENEYIRRATGYKFHEGDQRYKLDPDGILNRDGTAKTDTTDARTATELAYSGGLDRANPNRLNQLEDFNREGAEAGSQIATDIGNEQQGNALTGLVNAAGMASGRQRQATARQSDLAYESQQSAIDSAQNSAQQRSDNYRLANQAVGTAGAFAYKTGALDKYKKPDPNLVTRRKPGDHHPQ